MELKITQLKNKIKGIHAPLIELYSSQSEKYHHAIEIAFGNKNLALVVDNSKVAYEIIDVLKQELYSSRITFLPLDTIKKAPEKFERPKIDGVIDYAINLINFEDKYRDVIYYGLGETLIVENRDVADKLIKEYRMVTLDGIIFNNDGSIIKNSHTAINNYHLQYFKDWLFLTDINIETALKMIKHKSESEIKSIIDLSFDEIEDMLIKYDIKLTDKLTCEIKEGIKLTDREKDFFILVKKGYTLKEISTELMVTRPVVKKNINIFITKLLLGLYPDLKEQQHNI